MSRCLNIDWKAVDGASNRKRVLHLTPDEDNKFLCPVVTCLHDGYKSIRGVRKHIISMHPWYFYFDEQPRIRRDEAFKLPIKKLKGKVDFGIRYLSIQCILSITMEI